MGILHSGDPKRKLVLATDGRDGLPTFLQNRATGKTTVLMLDL